MRVFGVEKAVTLHIIYFFNVLLTATWLIMPVVAQNCPEFVAPVVTGQLADPRWTDISGLAASRRNPGVFWFHNDGGPGAAGSGDFFAVNRQGELLAEFTLEGVSTLQQQGEGRVDIEDVAVGPGPDQNSYLYFGDIGGNLYLGGGRTVLRVFRLREPEVSLTGGNTRRIVISAYETYKLNYSDEIRRDAETLMVDANGDIYIVTKAPTSGISSVYLKASPHSPNSTTTLENVATLQFGSGNLPGNRSATAGDFSVSGSQALIRTYNRVFLWIKPPNMTWSTAFATLPACQLPASAGGGYEAIAFDHTGTDYYDTFDSQGSTNTTEPINFYERVDQPPTDSQFFEVVARHSGKCLDVLGASIDDFAPIIQYDCYGGANQQWQFISLEEGYYCIVARHSGKVLDVFGTSTDDLAAVMQYSSHGGANQQWRLEEVGEGYYQIVARHSGKALDVFGASPENFTELIQYEAHGNQNQHWLLRTVQ